MPFFSNSSTRIESLIKETIRSYLKSVLGISGNVQIKRIEFFPIYGLCEFTEEKIITKLCVRVKNRTSYILVDVRNIEASGIKLVEFIDYLFDFGAKQIEKPANLLELI
jgi:hypothetical protein